jgi:hypothetical protein
VDTKYREATMTFDTLSYARRLKASGFTDQQAESLADATRELVVQDVAGNFATKPDLAALEQRLLTAMDAHGLRLIVRIGIMLAAGLSLMTALIGLLIKFH